MKSRYLIELRFLIWSLFVISLAVGFTYMDVGLSIASKDANKHKAIESFARYGFDPEIPGVQAGNKVLKESIITRFGSPLKTKTEVGPDAKEPQVINEIVTFEYSGLTLRIWRNDRAPKGQHEILDVILTTPQYQLKYGLRIGKTKAEFLKVLGAPQGPRNYKDRGERLRYEVGTDPDEKVDVYIVFDNNDLATQITWAPPPFD